MVCKYCKEMLPQGTTVCPGCGREVTAEPERKKNVWKTVALVVAGVVIAAIILGAVLYACGVDFSAGEKGVMGRESYTVSDSKGIQEADVVVATASSQELTNAELQIYYWYTVDNFISYYGNFLGYTGLDPTLPFEEQIYDAQTGMTWQQYFLEQALESWHCYAAMNLLAQDEGHVASENTLSIMQTAQTQMEQVAVAYGYESAEDMIRSDWGAVCNLDGYMRYLESNMLSMDYYDVKFNEMQPTDTEVEAYFAENAEDFEAAGVNKDSGKYVDARHILVMPQGGSVDDSGTRTYSEQEWEACRAAAQEILDEWLAGDATEDSFAALAGEYSEDGGSSSNGGLYEAIYEGKMVPEFNDWCFDDSREYGDYGLVKTTYGYHIMYYVGSQDVWYVNAKNELLNDRTEKMLEDATERWPMKVNYKRIVIGDLYGTGTTSGETVVE